MNPSFGNGGDGLHIEATISKDQEFSNNHIMNNGGAGLYVNVVNGTIENCSFSNNKKEGVRVTGSFSGVFKKCNFEGNEKEGLYSDASGSTYVVDSCDFSRNGTYGLYMSQCNFDLTNSTFDSNKGTAFVYDITKYNATTSLLSDNKFLHTNKAYPAFKTTNPYPVPEFTSCKMTKTTIVIEGKIDTAAIAKIELFYTSQGEQTAEMLVDSFYTNPDGTFSDTLDRSMFVGKSVISFNATATYGKITSPLSDLVSPSLGRVDLASTEFYVKMDGYGDGSSWENAMNLQTFIYYLPQVMNGSTFYVAEGRYVPTSKGFRINSSVSIVGGFSPDATSGAVADPVRYKTVFTGDPSGDDTVVEDQYLSDPSNDDVIFSEFDGHLFSAGNFDVHISGCELSGTRSSINRVPAISCGNLYLTNCTFEKTGIINGLDKKKVVADGCIFRNLIKGYTPSGLFEQDSVYVNNSVFENLQGLASTCFDRSLSIVDIRNSIFKNIKNGKSIFYSTKNVYLYNNLFVGVSQVNNETNFLLVKDTAVIIGNIFKDCDYENLVNTTDHTFIKHNLCEKILGTDDDINTGDLADFVVDGVYNKTTGTFVPTYSDWGGYVPTIVTKSDTLPDGRSIRFSLNETKVLTDQRSVSRLPKTCMGAYEIGCGSDTTFSTDTINVGTKIYGQTFTKVGVHDSIFETLQNAMGCDSVVMHKVVVKPDPTKLNYYVKMDKEGRGDGSDWDNAMDSTDFATYLPLAPDGATFYVAAGTYKPKFDKNLSPCKNPLACYTINSDVTILGGFPENATLKENPSSDPFKNITRFSGDLFGNDEFIYQNEEPGAKLLNIKNQEENVTSIFILTSPSEVKFNGIFISESPFVHGAINSSEIVSLTIENSCFEKNDGHIVVLTNPSELGKFTINNCKLVSNGVRSGGGSGVIFDMSCPIDAKKLTLKGNRLYSIFKSTKSLTADSIEIEDCVAEYGFLGNSSEENAELKHWIVKENKIRYFSMNVSNLTIDSSSFVSDSVSYFTANAKSLKISNSEIDSNHVEYDMYSGVNNLELYSTELKENHASRFFIGSGSTLSIDKCGFYSNDYDTYRRSSILNATIQNSSFIRNVSSSSTEAFLSIDKLALTNNTFANNKSINLIQMNGADLQNNTFVGNSTKQSILYAYSSGGTYNIEGNIIIGNQSDNNIFINVGYATNDSFSNNVMPLYSKVVKRESCTNVPDLTTNVVYSTDQLEGMTACETIDYSTLKKEKDILSILSGSFDSDEFIPELKNNGGFTPTVALKSDKLSDGTSIRFPRLENVLTDQRGVERLDSTCMGAYELGCVNDTTFTTDTIYVGDKILGQTFTKVGVHDSIFETLKSSLDCDSVVMHRVVVKPDPNTFNYYVKMDKEGRGDGSDWDNAMDSTDFATYLPLAPDGAVFYVAAGEYKPVYDINGNVSAWPLYNVNSSISIYGGFPADATGKEVPSEPDKYKTVLGYDVNCSFALFYSEKNELLSFVLDGVYVNDYCSYVIKMPSVDLTLRNSYFEGNSNFCDVSNEGSLNVVNTEFSKTQYTLFSMYGTKSVYMEDVKFVENIPSSYFYGDGYDVILKSVNATNNNGYYYFIGSKKLLVENSEFTKNSTGSYLLTTSGTVDIQNSLFDQNEGSMLINSDLSYEDSYINISKSKFSNNTTSSPVIYGARSSINCTLTESEFSNNNCYDLLFLIGSDYLTINDCEFLSNNCEKSNSNWTDDPFMIQIRASVKKIQIERNKIIDNKSLNSLVRCNCDTLIFKDCFLDKNNTDSRELLNFIICTNSQNTDKNVAFVERNTFSNNKCFYLMFLFNSSHDVYLRNNTIVSNECGSEIWYPKYSDVYLENNTIVGNKCKSVSEHDFLYKSMVGNFIFGNQYEKLYRISAPDIEGEPLYNVMPLTIDNLSIKVPNSTNIVSEYYIEKLLKELEDYPESDDISNVKDLSVEISSVLEGTYDPTTGLFTPVLAYNGGFTPTVALKKDVLPDGTSIRFPRLENVLEDQRGVERLDLTCMGAYEMKCTPIITELKDTVVVGDSYTFNEKNLDDVCKKVGSYYFSDTLTGAENCDSIVKLSLAVRPQKNENGYYVKENGTGDGSDWNNAMSPKDFAEYLPLVYDGETFHIAAGTYKSTYVDPELGRMYNINSSVTLIGGYPDTVTTVGVPPMPENFTTTLSANERGHINFYKERTGDFSVSGFGSDDSILIRVNGTSSVSLYGITLSGVKSSDNYGAVTMGQGGTLNLDRCTIENNNTSAVVASGAKINVTSSLAYHNVSKDGAVFRLSQSDLNVENSSFHENVSSDESSASRGAVANLTASQANFKNNTIANNWADKGAVFALSNSQVTLYNNTLVGNQSISKESNGSFVSASDSKSKATLFGNMIVGNGAKPVDGTSIESEGYNIFSTDFQGLGVETDMFMGPNDYESVMDGAPMLENADVFIPNVGDNGGLTPTVAVIESMFDGGAVISIPADQRRVNEDQREMVRKDTSCVGAFEFPTYVNYFVKQLPVGDGTGRDWDNAMGDTTFSRYFSIVPTGATFHVAAGTYRPLEDRRYRTNSYKNRLYYTSRPLNVFGGYHPQAKIGAVADPSKYVTLFTADFNGDDEFAESTDNYSVMSYSNHNDNSSYVMTINSKVAGDVQLKGLTFSGNFTQFRGSSAALTVSTVAPEIPVALTIDSCSFKKTYVGIYSYVDSLIVRDCRFDTINYLGLSHSPHESVPSILVVENSSFTNMSSAVSLSASKGNVVLQNSTFNNAMSLVNVNTNSYNNVVDLNLEMYHNTFGFSSKSYQGISIPQYIKTIAKGNIFNTNFLLTSDYSGTNAMTPIVSDYNLFVEEPDTTFGAWTLGENDMLVAPSDLTGVMPGTMGEKRFLAVSSMEKSENFTKVVALESDVLNEKYIRMPIEEAKVKADQIATERLDLTCMGAYEFFKGRDTVYTHNVDTVCLGLAYDRNGWQLQSDTLPVGKYVYGRFLRGKIATDTIDTLTLHVNPFSKIMLDQLAVAPTLCHGSGYGEVSFTPRSVVPGS
ncbi:MAG: right-handed parallel beta-helix repeat-containing protein, partial [Paludibacteraceae bacterium]|nr:right-handed parallel beta-helix repeat-containing protein [Paludibacteraceae bacterium]